MKRIAVIFTGLLIFSIAFAMVYSYSYQMSQTVPFEDESLEAVIRDTLDLSDEDITIGRLREITELNAKGKDITSLRGIEYVSDLEVLNLEDNFIKDVRPLQHLENLEVLNLRNNEITSLQDIHFYSLTGLENLKELSLRHNVKRPDFDDGSYQYRIEDITILSEFTTLEKLNLRDNHIQDATPLESMSELRELDLSQNPIKNGELGFIKNFVHLTELNLRETSARNIHFLNELQDLTYLNLHSNADIHDFSPIRDLVGLETLIIPNVKIGEEIDVIKNLTALTRLNVRNTGIEDVTMIGQLMEGGALQDQPGLGIEANVDVSENPISVEKQGRANGYGPIRDYWNNISVREPEDLLSPKNQQLYINEFMTSNGGTLSDDEGNYHDWIELYNPADGVIDLTGYYLSDDETNPTLWEIPEVEIAANDYLVFWASGEDQTDNDGMHHTNFSISRQGEPIMLIAPDGEQTIDYIAQREVPRDISFGRFPDGEDNLTYFSNPTPGQANVDEGFDAVALAPRFSHQGGFYDEAFELELTANEKDQIYYTLDGSEPSDDSSVYQSSLSIQESINRGEDGFPEATVVRAVTKAENNEWSKVTTHTYFVGEDINDQFTFPVIALNTDSNNLFDEEIGIYAEDNYENRGRDWERPMAFEIYEPNGMLGLSQNLGGRIQGGLTRNRDQKSFRLYARGSYDENDCMDYEFFPALQTYGEGDEEVHSFKRILLRNSGNDHGDLSFRDAFMQSLVEDIGSFAPQASRPAITFINGEYWGIYNIRERQDEYYLQTHFDGVDPENVTILEGNTADFDKGNPDGEGHYHDMLNYIEQHGLEDDEHYQYIKTMMDVDNFIDYFVAQVYFANSDWPGSNTRFWRTLTDEYDPEAVEGLDGRWRWLLYDTDHGFEMFTSDDRRGDQRGVVHDTVKWILHPGAATFLNRHLLENDEFHAEFNARFANYLNIHFNTERVIHQIDYFEDLYADEMALHLDRWGLFRGEINDWHESIETLRNFARKRPDYVRTHLDYHLGLGDQFDLTIEFDDHHMGTVLINGLDAFMYDDVDYTSTWQGVYFEAFPIEIEPLAKEGYAFTGWEGESFGTNELITISEDTVLQPIFEEIESDYYVVELDGVRQARLLNYIFSYVLALLVGALGIWTVGYFASTSKNRANKILVTLTLLTAIVLSVPVFMDVVNHGAGTLTDALSIRLLALCLGLGGFIGLVLPKRTKEIRVFNA